MTSNKKTLKVLHGFLNLSENERNTFIKELNTYIRSNPQGKLTFSKNVKTQLSQQLGPTSDDFCPCCGKS